MSEETVVDAPVIETPSAVVIDQNPTESEPEVKAEIPATQDDTLPKPDKQQSKFDKRIAQLNRKIGEQQARADMLERQLEESRPKPQAPASKLRIEDFDYDVEKWGAAIAKEAEETALKRHSENQQAQTQKQTVQRIASEWEAKAAKAESKYDDYDEVVPALKPTTPVAIAIMQAENGADIAYYLGKNPQEVKRIDALDTVSAIREIGRLEAKLLSEPPAVKQPSSAPAPITPVKGSSSANKTIFDEGLSQAEFEKIRNAQIKRR